MIKNYYVSLIMQLFRVGSIDLQTAKGDEKLLPGEKLDNENLSNG